MIKTALLNKSVDTSQGRKKKKKLEKNWGGRTRKFSSVRPEHRKYEEEEGEEADGVWGVRGKGASFLFIFFFFLNLYVFSVLGLGLFFPI